MLQISEVKGVVFDVDETLLDTGVHDPVNALHEQARLQAIHEAGRRHGVPELLALTPQQNLDGFLDAPVHTLESAVWTIFRMTGLATTDVIDYQNQLFREIVARKDELFERLLREQGKPIPGAVEFVHVLGELGLASYMAIASTARRHDIDIFLETTGLQHFFPDNRIIAKDSVTHAKPHPEAFDKAFKALGLPETTRNCVLAFEDNPRGVMSSKAAGLFTCAITTVHTREQLQSQPVVPDLIAESFSEFEQLLGVHHLS